MRPMLLYGVCAAALYGAPGAADSARGAKVFESLRCIQCHSAGGKGGSTAPDLSHRVDRGFTPASLAATMWNHAPTMWAAMGVRGLAPGELNEQGAADLFAYFYSLRFFDVPGDAARGKRAFQQRGCAGCHGPEEISEGSILSDPIALAEVMWNHQPRMMESAALRGMRWPELKAGDLGDILVYLRPSKARDFRVGDGTEGATVFKKKRCASCHAEGSALAHKIGGETLTAIAAAMWNHAPAMRKAGAQPVQFKLGEMRALLSYLWARQFFLGDGNASAGRRVFDSKQCSVCHGSGSSGAPKLPDATRRFTGAVMVAALWHHGPSMLRRMEDRGITWPRFERGQMDNLIAYLNSADGTAP